MKNNSFLINSIRKSVFAKKKIIRLDELIITSQVLRINNHLEEKYFHVRTSPSFNETVGPVSRRRNDRGKGGWEGESSWKGKGEGRKRGARFHKAILRTLFSHAHVESKARPISYGDSLTSGVHHRICLYRRRYWQPSFDEACRGGWLGSSMTGLRRLCARLERVSCSCVLPLSFFRYICLHLRLCLFVREIRGGG